MSTSYDSNCFFCDECVPCRYIDHDGRIFDTEQTGTVFRSAGGDEIVVCVACYARDEDEE